ncbi:hypothetical protein ACL02S_12200 [Nocardia sp. 004]|uniref:hypothetical protein n=1 Tax=Nocardia sp. 004 TaxID=3385978 RepID=UPI00399F8A85
MLDVSYRRLLLDQDTQQLDVSKYLARESTEDPARREHSAQHVVAGAAETEPSTSD